MKHWAGREETRLEMTGSQTIGESQHVAVVVNQNMVKLENPLGWKSWLIIIAQEACISFQPQPGTVVNGTLPTISKSHLCPSLVHDLLEPWLEVGKR